MKNLTKKIICLVLIFQIPLFGHEARADELSDLSWRINTGYKKIIPQFREIAELSPKAAKEHINLKIDQLIINALGGIEKTYKSFANEIPKLATCKIKLEAISNQLSPVIAEEAMQSAQTLDKYRRNAYSADNLIAYSDLVFQVQKNYADCIGLVDAAVGRLLGLAATKAEDFCPSVNKGITRKEIFESIYWPHHVRAKVDGQFLNNFPGVQITATTNTDCSNQGEHCDDSSYGAEAQKVESGQGVSEAQAKAYSGASMLGFGVSTGLQMTGMSGASASGYGILVALIAIIVLTAYFKFEISSRVKDLKKKIDEYEGEIRRIRSNTFIGEEELSNLKAKTCNTRFKKFKGDVVQAIEELNIDEHLENLAWFGRESDRLVSWYNSLFLWASEGSSGQRVLDQLAVEKFATVKAGFFKATFQASALQEKSVLENDLRKSQAAVSLVNCDPSEAQFRDAERQLKHGLNFFSGISQTVLEILSLETASIPLVDGSISDITCHYSGIDRKVRRLIVDKGSGFANQITLLDEAGGVLKVLPEINSNSGLLLNQYFPGFGCDSSSQKEFGTTAGNQLVSGSYEMLTPNNTRGLSAEDATAIQQVLLDTGEKVAVKVRRCSKLVGGL